MSAEEQADDRLGDIWRHQLVSTITLTPEQLAAHHTRLRKAVHRSLVVEYVACAILTVWWAWRWWRVPGGWLTQTYYVLMVAGVFVVARGLHRHLAGYQAPDHGANLLAFQRISLDRLRQSVSTAWRWYLLPFVPAVVVMGIDRWFFQHAAGRPVDLDHTIIVLCLVIIAALFGAIALWHQLVASKLQRAIDYLDAFRSEG